MRHSGGRRWRHLMVALVATALATGACGGGGDTTNSSAATTIAANGSGQGDSGQAGSIAFQIAANCTRAVSDGKDFLAMGCPGSISRLDHTTGKARWTAGDPTWSEIVSLELAGEVVVASVRVVVPASGVTAKQEGNRVVAVADGKKLWETKLFPPSPAPSPRLAATTDVTVVAQGGESRVSLPPTVAAFDTRSGRQRWEKAPANRDRCASVPLIFKDSVAACDERFALSDGASLGFQAPFLSFGSDPSADIAAVQLDNTETAFALVGSDGRPLGTVKGNFMGFAGATVVVRRADLSGRSGTVAGVNPDGSVRWEQPVSFDTSRGYFDNLSFANGAVWVRNASNELTAIDGATGKLASPIPANPAGLNRTAKVLATTGAVVVVATGDGERVSALKAVAK